MQIVKIHVLNAQKISFAFEITWETRVINDAGIGDVVCVSVSGGSSIENIFKS